MSIEVNREAIRKVIKEFGGQAKMAVIIGLSQQSMANWVKQGYIPIKHLRPIMNTTKVPAKNLVSQDYLDVHEWLKEQENVL